MVAWVSGKVVARRDWTDRLYSLSVEADVAPFTAGQFTRLAMDIDGERIARPYSYVNAPGQQPLEFYFVTVPGGPLTAQLPALDVGDEIFVQSKAAGFFTLDEVPESDHLWMLSTGTAIGPFLSILGTPAPWQRFKKIILVHGVRTAAELSYRDQVRDLQQAHTDTLITLSFVSRESADHAMAGRITSALENGDLEASTGLGISPESSQFMVCGNPEMVSDTSRLLQARGLKKNRRREPGQITTENYWKAAR